MKRENTNMGESSTSPTSSSSSSSSRCSSSNPILPTRIKPPVSSMQPSTPAMIPRWKNFEIFLNSKLAYMDDILVLPKNNHDKLRQNIYRLTQAIIVIWIISFLFILHHSPLPTPDTSSSGTTTLSSSSIPSPTRLTSVVLVNFSRPRMIQSSSLMTTLISHPSIGEILLLHANPKTQFEYVHPKVVNIDATHENDEMGLSLRFYFCQYAKYDRVIQVDDDMEVSWSAINALMTEFERDQDRIVGRFGRDLSQGRRALFHGYSSKDTRMTTDVVLTKFMIMQRDLCTSFFKYSPLIWQEVLEGEGPLWNGEDIFMSLVAQHVYKKKNYAMDWLDVRPAPDELKDYTHGRLDISGGFEGFRFWDWHWWQSLLRRNRHYDYRGKLWRIAMSRLSGCDY